MEPEPKLVKRLNRNRNPNFSKVGTGTGIVKNSYGVTTLLITVKRKFQELLKIDPRFN